VLTVGTAVLICISGLTAFHAAALVGNSCFVPMVCDLRFPLTHCKNRQVRRDLSHPSEEVVPFFLAGEDVDVPKNSWRFDGGIFRQSRHTPVATKTVSSGRRRFRVRHSLDLLLSDKPNQWKGDASGQEPRS
jgi:hypothetical protein